MHWNTLWIDHKFEKLGSISITLSSIVIHSKFLILKREINRGNSNPEDGCKFTERSAIDELFLLILTLMTFTVIKSCWSLTLIHIDTNIWIHAKFEIPYKFQYTHEDSHILTTFQDSQNPLIFIVIYLLQVFDSSNWSLL